MAYKKVIIWTIVGLVIASLLTICILFTVWDIKFNASLKKAATATGHCVDGETDCENKPNDRLGLPSFNTTTYVRQDSSILADLVGRLEYAAKNDLSEPTTPPDFTLLKTLNDKYGNMFIGMWTTQVNDIASGGNAKQLYVAIRGSQTEQEWKKDLETIQVAWPEAPSYVHKGFLNIYQLNQQVILDMIKEYDPKFVYITGHSLGAAIATMTALDVSKLPSIKTAVYNFASPRVGNTEFAALVDTNVKLFRTVNIADIVNDLPLSVHPNFHGNHNPFEYAHAGIQVLFNMNWASWENNHLIPVYNKCLQDPSCSISVPILLK